VEGGVWWGFGAVVLGYGCCRGCVCGLEGWRVWGGYVGVGVGGGGVNWVDGCGLC